MICFRPHATYPYLLRVLSSRSLNTPTHLLLFGVKYQVNLQLYPLFQYLSSSVPTEVSNHSQLGRPHPTRGIHISLTMEIFFITLAVIFVPVLVFLIYLPINGERYVEIHEKYIKH